MFLINIFSFCKFNELKIEKFNDSCSLHSSNFNFISNLYLLKEFNFKLILNFFTID